MSELPLVSVLIPTYNRADLLQLTVQSSLAQTYMPIEVIVGDNASSDHTPEMLTTFNDPRLSVIRHPHNLGMVGNWDSLIDQAAGEYFLLLSDDDLLEPDTVAGLVTALREHPEAGFAFCSVVFIDAAGKVMGGRRAVSGLLTGREVVAGFLSGQHSPYLCGTLYNRHAFRSEFRFGESRCRMSVDAAAWMGIALASGAACSVSDVACLYRIHSGGETSKAGIENWIADLRILEREVTAALVQMGQDQEKLAEWRALFARHTASTIESLLFHAPRARVADFGRNLSLLWRYQHRLRLSLGDRRVLFAAARLMLPERIDLALRKMRMNRTRTGLKQVLK